MNVERPRLGKWDWPVAIAIVCVLLIAVLVMVGWFIRSTLLIQVLPEFAPMQFNTALLFAVSSIGILGMLRKRERLTLGAGLLVILFSFVTGIQYPLEITIGLDELFIDSNTLVQTSHPGRMVPNTVLCFFLTGFCLITRVRKPKSSLFAIGACLILALSVVALFGYLSQTVEAYGWGNLTRMAVHTALGFLLFSGSFILLGWRWAISENEDRTVPDWFPFFCGILTLTAGLCAWSVASKLELARDSVEEGWAAEVFRMIFNAKLSSETLAIERLTKRWEIGVRDDHWKNDSNRYIRNINGLKAIFRTSEGKLVESFFNNDLTEKDRFQNPRMLETFIATSRAREIKRSTLAAVPVTFTGEEKRGFLVAVPIDEKQDKEGMIIAYIEFAGFFANSTKRLELVFDYRLIDTDGSILVGPPFPEEPLVRPRASLNLNNRGQKWKVQAIPKGGGLESPIGIRLSELVLISMVLFSILVTALAALAQRYYRVQGKRSDEEIRLANEELETMLFIIAHDLREPLRTVMSFSSLASLEHSEKLGKDGRDLLDRVVKGGAKIEKILEGVTDVAKADKIERSREPIDLGQLVKEEIAQFEEPIQATGAEIRVATNLPSIRVDEIWVRQAIANLIGNALKFHKNGKPKVVISKYAGKEGIGIVVRDFGVGIPGNMEEKIFDLFRRGVSASTPGTGIGLAIVKRVALRHGGKAWAKNREGGGAEFFVTFAPNRS